MKKTLLFISAITIGFSSYSQHEGFENWTQNTVQALDDYQTTVNDRGLEGANSTFPSTDAHTGTYSVRLETVLSSQGDTVFGYFIDGDPDSGTPGQAVSLNNVDSIIGFYKCDILPNDSALLLVQTTFMSNPTGGGLYYIKGTQPTWKRFAYNVNAIAADSMLFGAASSDAINEYNGKPGSWIQFDDIQLKSTTGQTMNVMNSSFENWTPLNWEDPNGWQTFNIWALGQPAMPAVKSTDSYAGSYALELNNILTQDNDTLWGAATNGYWGENGPQGGEPFTGSPVAVECYYKYAPASGDNANISIQFKQGGSIVGNYGTGINAAGTYTLWNQATTPMTPDSVLISIWSGNKIGTQLKVDNIDIVFAVGVAEGLTVEKIVTYPNPTSDVLNIRFNIENDNDVKIRLIDVTGKVVSSRSLGHLSSGTYKETFNTSNLSTGAYFIEFNLGKEKVVERFIVK